MDGQRERLEQLGITPLTLEWRSATTAAATCASPAAAAPSTIYAATFYDQTRTLKITRNNCG
jgi:hypothetical protein